MVTIKYKGTTEPLYPLTTEDFKASFDYDGCIIECDQGLFYLLGQMEDGYRCLIRLIAMPQITSLSHPKWTNARFRVSEYNTITISKE